MKPRLAARSVIAWRGPVPSIPLLAAVLLGGPLRAGAEPTSSPATIPSVRQWRAEEGSFRLTASTRVICSESDMAALGDDPGQFAEDVERLTGVKPEVSTDPPSVGDIVVSLTPNDGAVDDEGYRLRVGERLQITAAGVRGVFYGMQTVLQLLARDGSVPRGVVEDRPTFAERGFMIDCGRHYFEVEYLERLIRRLAWMKMNFIHLHLTEWNGFRIESNVYPGLASEQAYSREDLRRIQDYAARFHVTVIPEVDLPAHATHITEYDPRLAFTCPSMRRAQWQGEPANSEGKAFTLDITRTEVRDWIRRLLDEVIPQFDGPYFHIGGDEWQYDIDKLACPELMQAMRKKGYEHPGDVFVEWINEVNEQVKSHGKTTQIWNWWRFSPNKQKQNRTSIQPAKDIVVNIWNRPRRAAILGDGYQSIITTEEGRDALYVTPFEGGGKVGDYGVFDSRYIFGRWEPTRSPNVRGFKVCLWCDRSEHQPDDWFDQHYDLPLAVLSERVWCGENRSNFEEFKESAASLTTLTPFVSGMATGSPAGR